MDEAIALVNQLPGGWVFALFLLLVFGSPAILSKTAAEKFGALGVIARWWRDRPLVRIENEERQVAAEVAVLEARVKTLEEHIKTIVEEQRRERAEYRKAAAEDRKAWKEALESAEREIEVVRAGIRVRDTSFFDLYDWSIRARAESLKGGVVLPPIPEITFLAVADKNDQAAIEERVLPEDTMDS